MQPTSIDQTPGLQPPRRGDRLLLGVVEAALPFGIDGPGPGRQHAAGRIAPAALDPADRRQELRRQGAGPLGGNDRGAEQRAWAKTVMNGAARAVPRRHGSNAMISASRRMAASWRQKLNERLPDDRPGVPICGKIAYRPTPRGRAAGQEDVGSPGFWPASGRAERQPGFRPEPHQGALSPGGVRGEAPTFLHAPAGLC